jgi:hypothetical protein
MISILREQGTIWKILSQSFLSRETKKYTIIFTCMQISSTIGGPKSSNRMQGKIFIHIIHKIVCLFLDVLGAKNQKAAIPSFTTGIVSIFRRALYKDGAAKITKDLCRHGLLPEPVDFLSPSQAGHEGAVRSIANQMELETGEMPTLVAAASELGRRGNQGAVRSIANQMELKTGGCRHWRRRLPSWAEGVTKARLTPLSRQEWIPRMPLHFVEGTHTTATLPPLLRQESIPRTHLFTLQGGYKTVEEFAPTFV